MANQEPVNMTRQRGRATLNGTGLSALVGVRAMMALAIAVEPLGQDVRGVYCCMETACRVF